MFRSKSSFVLNEDFELKLCNNKEEWKKYDVTLLQLPTSDFFAAPSQV